MAGSVASFISVVIPKIGEIKTFVVTTTRGTHVRFYLTAI